MYHPAVPERIFSSLPEAKLLIVLRNPVDRAISQYKWMRQIGLETRDARDAFRKEASQLDLEQNPAYLKQFRDPLHFEFDHIYRSYLRRSLYHVQLRRWLRNFPESQIRVLSSKALFGNTHEVIGEISRFLGIEHHRQPQKNAVSQNASRDDIEIPADARMIAKECLSNVETKTKSVLSSEMIIGHTMDLQ
ncbi:hypothetical protein GGP52_003071 [Salinibacter ruber]|nr:hypothetical protein [Salinibacter ruber]